MKIAICGKGGCGKSTTTALLAKALARAGKRVLVVDSDESNYGLHRQLGMELPKDFTAFFGGKENVLKDMMLSNFAHKFFDGPWSLSDIPEGYCGKKDGLMLMSSGKIHQANEGCACAMNNVIQQFIANLRLSENEFALMDMEAGIEHFLAKPFFMSSFKETIQRMLGGEQKTALSAGGGSVLTGKHVLVVDDIALNRTILMKILATLGAVCDEAENSQAALEKFDASPAGRYDLILMDIQMPILNGYEAARQIRAIDNPKLSGLPIIAMTANAFDEDRRAALEAGMNGHIAKPIDIPGLMELLKEILKSGSSLD